MKHYFFYLIYFSLKRLYFQAFIQEERITFHLLLINLHIPLVMFIKPLVLHYI